MPFPPCRPACEAHCYSYEAWSLSSGPGDPAPRPCGSSYKLRGSSSEPCDYSYAAAVLSTRPAGASAFDKASLRRMEHSSCPLLQPGPRNRHWPAFSLATPAFRHSYAAFLRATPAFHHSYATFCRATPAFHHSYATFCRATPAFRRSYAAFSLATPAFRHPYAAFPRATPAFPRATPAFRHSYAAFRDRLSS